MTAQTVDLNPAFVSPDEPIPGQVTVEEAIAAEEDQTAAVVAMPTLVPQVPVQVAAPSTTASLTSPTPTTVPAPAPPAIDGERFEGAKVEGAGFLISGKTDVESYDEQLVSVDDRVRLVGEYRCIGVNFKLNPKTGDFVRVQVLKPIKVELCPWDPADPNDNGIFRMVR